MSMQIYLFVNTDHELKISFGFIFYTIIYSEKKSICLPNLKEYKILLFNKQNNELLNNLYKQYWVLFCNIRLLVTSLHHILLLIKSQVSSLLCMPSYRPCNYRYQYFTNHIKRCMLSLLCHI